jgi:hypothetical protein
LPRPERRRGSGLQELASCPALQHRHLGVGGALAYWVTPWSKHPEAATQAQAASQFERSACKSARTSMNSPGQWKAWAATESRSPTQHRAREPSLSGVPRTAVVRALLVSVCAAYAFVACSNSPTKPPSTPAATESEPTTTTSAESSDPCDAIQEEWDTTKAKFDEPPSFSEDQTMTERFDAMEESLDEKDALLQRLDAIDDMGTSLGCPGEPFAPEG